MVVLKRNAVLRLLWNEMRQQHRRPDGNTCDMNWDDPGPLRALDHYVAHPHTRVFGCDDERRWALPNFIQQAGRATRKLGITWAPCQRGETALREMQITYGPDAAFREMHFRIGVPDDVNVYETWCCSKLRQLMLALPPSVMSYVAAASKPCLLSMRPTLQLM